MRVRSLESFEAKQKIPYYLGVSGKTSGATALSLNLIVVPPHASAEPHTHSEFESAVYIISGRAIHHWGDKLQYTLETNAGDFLFIEPGVPHEVFNLSQTEPVVAVVARSDADEWQNIIPYDRESEA